MRQLTGIAPYLVLAVGLTLVIFAADCANMCRMRDAMHVDMPCLASIVTQRDCSWATFRALAIASVTALLTSASWLIYRHRR